MSKKKSADSIVKVKVKQGEEPLYAALYASFGYQLCSAKPYEKYTMFSFQRTRTRENQIPGMARERQFKKACAKFPTAATIITLIGLILLILGIVLPGVDSIKNIPSAADIIKVCGYSIGGILLMIGISLFIVFIIMKCNKKRIAMILVQGDRPTLPDLPPFQAVGSNDTYQH